MNISEMKISTFWKGEVGVKAACQDGDKTYQVSLYIRSSKLRDCSCSCAEGISYKGPCVHAKALYEKYQNENSRQTFRPVYTDQEVRAMIREYTNREVAQIMQENETGLVRLEPVLLVEQKGKEIRLELQIGRERLYTIRDLSAFVQAIETGAQVSYGKNLTFYHNLDAFNEESRPLAGFAAELVNTYHEYFSRFGKTSFEVRPKLRELALNRENRDRFFSMYVDKKIRIRIGRAGTIFFYKPSESGFWDCD